MCHTQLFTIGLDYDHPPVKWQGMVMKEKSAEPIIDLDPSELLGLSQVVKVSDPEATAKLLSKVGEGPGTQPSPIGRLLSKIGGEGPQLISDIRLKTDIRQVGTTAHNLPLYTFRYIGKDDHYEGVMAQDVLKVVAQSGKRR